MKPSLSVDCPKCGEKAGLPCRNYKGVRCAPHAGRGDEFRKVKARRPRKRWVCYDLFPEDTGPEFPGPEEGGSGD